MSGEMSARYEPGEIENEIYQTWLKTGSFAATPDEREKRYVVMMPLPNVTGALHMGHAMDNVMQDLLVRWHRMQGDNSLWMAGTDHAGIATQSVVETRLFQLEEKTRHDIGREALVQRIWDWKEEYQARIVSQQQMMGCSCDWDRQRFTMDAVCARAVRETFFQMFRDGLIYKGNRLVNWDCQLQTAVSDDEVVHATVRGHFWHLRYPLVDRKDGEPECVIVATTRPETMLGDTAVAVHPDPEASLDASLAKLRERLGSAPKKDRAGIESEIERLETRKEEELPRLLQLVAFAKSGRKLMLPLMEREIPLILDEWAKPELGSGCVKVTPAHDPNDYEVWQRHPEIGAVNLLEVDGTLAETAGVYAGLDRFEARKKVVADLEARGLLEATEDREIEVGHSDRSNTPVEPYLSEQWFVRMGDVEGGILMGRGTGREFRSPGLAQAAIDAVEGDWRSPGGLKLSFHPNPRYAETYVRWLSEKRDWCISRQLWWGHRIPVWQRDCKEGEAAATLSGLPAGEADRVHFLIVDDKGRQHEVEEARGAQSLGACRILACPRSKDDDERLAGVLEGLGFEQDPDVLDTWFSSALWPHSTLGWPDPSTAELGEGQSPLGATDGRPDALSYYYPGSCLVTGRDIITLWVARMVITGLYNLGELPFTDTFIHANILDGKGERMSKSKGNGIDPVDIIESYGADAMRYVVSDMQTGLQDIRLPVQAESPYTHEVVDLAKAKRGTTRGTFLCPKTGKEFDVIGTRSDLPKSKVTSDRFEVGRNFCNKLWNASRFAMMNLASGQDFEARSLDELFPEDRWILSRLESCRESVQRELLAYNPSAALAAARQFFWDELCDWYLEIVKPRMHDDAHAGLARQVLAAALDQVLRLLHPFVPFITEGIWRSLGSLVPQRGVTEPFPESELLIRAAWPSAAAEMKAPKLEEDFELFRSVVRAIRDIRAKYSVSPTKPLGVRIRVGGAAEKSLVGLSSMLTQLAKLESLEISADAEAPELAATQVLGEIEVFVAGVLDPAKEKERLEKQRGKLEQFIRAGKGKLANENFVGRAPAEVVETERQKLRDLEAQLATVDELLGRLG